MGDTDVSARILAVEPDPRRRAALRGLLEEHICADTVVVPDGNDALRAIAEHVPDLVLTSMFLPPADVDRIVEALRSRADATHTQVVTAPIRLTQAETIEAGQHPPPLLRPLRRRNVETVAPRDSHLLRDHVEPYLDQARMLLAAARARHQPQSPGTSLVRAGNLDPCRRVMASMSLPRATAAGVSRNVSALRPRDRRGALRRRAADLAGQWGVRLNPSGDARIVDISRTGVRLETDIRLYPGRLIDLEVIGVEGHTTVSARLIRSERIDADSAEPRYRAAAMFLRELDLFAPGATPLMVAAAAATCHTPTVLAAVLGRVTANANWAANGAALRSEFEREIAVLVRAREVRIRAVPVHTAHGCESLYFSIPGASGTNHALHVVFERDHRPTAAEFRLLKAAASLGSVVLDLAPVV